MHFTRVHPLTRDLFQKLSGEIRNYQPHEYYYFCGKKSN